METNLYHDQYIGEEAANIEAMSKEELFEGLDKLGNRIVKLSANAVDTWQSGFHSGYTQAIEDQGWKRYLHFVYGFISACVVAAVVLLVKEAMK